MPGSRSPSTPSLAQRAMAIISSSRSPSVHSPAESNLSEPLVKRHNQLLSQDAAADGISEGSGESGSKSFSKQSCKTDESFCRETLKGFSWTSMFALCMLQVVNGLQLDFLNNSYRGLEIELGFNSEVNANFNLATMLGFALFCPLWGALTDRFSRKWLLLIGYIGWVAPIFFMAFCSHAWQFYVWRFVKGAMGGSLFPATNSILMEVTPRSRYGSIQGVFAFVSQISQVIAAYAGVTTSEISIRGVGAWRYGYVGLSAFGAVVGIIFFVCMKEPTNHRATIPLTWSSEWKRCKRYGRMSMVWIIVLNGMFSTIPVAAMTYLTLFYQYNGLTDDQCGRLLVIRGIIGPCSNVIGGILSDRWEMQERYRGRIYAGILSALVTLPLSIWLITLPVNHYYFEMSVALNSLVLLFSWNLQTVNRPLFAEIVHPDDRGTIFAWDISIESLLSSFIAFPTLGVLSAQAGYDALKKNLKSISGT